MKTRIAYCLAIGLITLWRSPLLAADEPLKISVYATAESVSNYLGTAEARKATIAVLKSYRVSKVYVEGNRIDSWVTVDMLRAVRDDLVANGIEASGGVGPLPGKTFGVHVSGHEFWLDYGAAKTQQDVARAFTESAAVFDEMIVDDFYCFDEGSPQYRRDELVRLVDTMMWKPARAVRPSFHLIIKIPQWYDRFQEFGYDPERMMAASERIWIGTETRNPETPSLGFVQPTEGYVNFRWLSAMAGSKTGGAWFDTLDCTAQNFLDQAYQSVLADAHELTIFNLAMIMRGHPGHALFKAALPQLFDLAGKVRGLPAKGIAYYKPSSSDGEENLYLMEYLPMIGLPIVPTPQFPSGWPVIFLGSQAAADHNLLDAMKRELSQGATLVVTPALLRRMDPAAAEMAGVTVSPRLESGMVGGLEVDLSLAVTRAQTRLSIAGSIDVMASVTDSRGVVTSLASEQTARGRAYWPTNRPIGSVAAPTVDRQVPLLTMCKSSRGQILVANVRAFSRTIPPTPGRASRIPNGYSRRCGLGCRKYPNPWPTPCAAS